MPSILNSDDGVVSGTSGLKTTGGNDGILALQNNGTTNVTVTAAGNVGVGTASPLTKFTVSGGYISQTDGTIRTYLGADGSGGSLVGTTTNQYFRFITNDTERMRISSAGIVTMLNQPAFRAGFAASGDASTTSSDPVPFDAETFDAGGNYNTSNYRFTAPVAGRYLFHANVYFSQSAGSFTGGIGFLLNGAQVNTTAGDAARSDGNFGSGSGQMTILSLNNTILLNLAAGDYVQVFGINYSGSPASFRYYRGTSFWQGTLIS